MQNGKSKKKYYGIVGAVTFAALFSIFINEASSEAKKKIQPKKITAEASVQMTKGEKETLSYRVKPKKTTNKKVIFSSSNKKIVTVSKTGALQAKSEGTATITIRSKAKKQIKKKVKISVAAPKKIQRTLPVTVPKTMQPQTAVQTALDELEMSALSANTSITKITLDRTYIKLAAGESDRLTATVFPVTSTEKLTWNCDFFGGINVYQDGRIFITEDTPVGTTATITVFSGKVSATCQIVVVQGPCQHVWGNWAIVENPKCTKEGLRRSICTKCSKVREEPVAATGHSWLSKTVTDATCDAVGEREDTCQNCGEKKREVIPAKGHDWASNGTIKTEPTCTKAGEMEYVCNICKKTKTEPIPANGHSWDLGEITKSPTCTVAGVRTYHCTVDGCAGTKKETIEATGHTWTYGEITEEPGCTYRTDIRTIKALGHDWDAGVVTKNPDCYNMGQLTQTCQRPGCTKTRRSSTPKLEHQFENVVLREPTCTTNGKRCDKCKLCNKTKNEVMIPATGHNWKKVDADTVDPTCTKDGSAHYKCINTYTKDGKTLTCGADKIEILDATGHNYSSTYTIDKKPGCVTKGVQTKHCTNTYKNAAGNVVACTSTTDAQSIAPTGHSFGGWTQTLAPSHGISGLEQRTCSVCKEVQERTVNSGHSYTADGKCNSCSKSFTFVKTTAKDWDYVTDDTAKTILLKKYTGTNTAIEIPAKMDATVSGVTSSYQVVFAGHYEDRTKAGVFASNKKVQIQAVTFENGVQIDNMDYMFSGCESLEVISNIPSTVTSMLGTFKNCTSLCTVSALPANVENLSNTFEGCESMETAPAIPDDVTSLYATFKKCSSLSAAPTIPSKLTNMDWTFSGCASITAAPALPDTVTSMTNTFEGCKNLLDIPANIPEGVKKLTMTFYDCDALEMIPVLPNTIEEMEYTFKNCDNLSYAAGLPKNLIRSVGVFDGCDKYEA